MFTKIYVSSGYAGVYGLLWIAMPFGHRCADHGKLYADMCSDRLSLMFKADVGCYTLQILACKVTGMEKVVFIYENITKQD